MSPENSSLSADLLPGYAQWQKEMGTSGLSLWDYLRHTSTAEQAAAYTALFWPEFIEVDGCVLLKASYSPEALEQWEEWRRETGAERRQVEATLNHVHLYDLFPSDHTGEQVNRVRLGQLEHLARVLCHTWVCALHAAFPGRQFEFSYATEPDEYGPTISFWQVE